MRIKLLLENEVGVKKRKTWFLFDEGSCVKVIDVAYLIRRRFYSCDGKISLSLDDFLLPPQEDVGIIRDNDTITVKITSHTTSKINIPSGKAPSCSPSSIDEEEEYLPAKKKYPSTINGKSAKPFNKLTKKSVPVSKSSVYSSIKKDTLDSSSSSEEEPVPDKKVASNNNKRKVVATNRPVQKATVTADKNKPAEKESSSDSSNLSDKPTEKKIVSNNKTKAVPVRQLTNKTVPLSKLGVRNVVKKQESSDSSSSSDDDSQNSRKTFLPTDNNKNSSNNNKNKKTEGLNKIQNKQIVNIKPVAKKGVSVKSNTNVSTKNDPSSGSSEDSSSSSSDESEPPKKKVAPTITSKNTVLTGCKPAKTAVKADNAKVSNLKHAVDSTISKMDNSVNKITKQDSSSSSSSNSSAYDVEKKKVIDFHIAKQETSNLGNPPIKHTNNANLSNNKQNTQKLSNTFRNKNNNNYNNNKAKNQLSKDVYKNKSQLIVSKPFTRNNTSTPLNAVDINPKQTQTISSTVKSQLDEHFNKINTTPLTSADMSSKEASKHSNSVEPKETFIPRTEQVSGRAFRRRRRNQTRKENKRSRQFASAEVPSESNDSGVASVIVNGSIESLTLDGTNQQVNGNETAETSETVNGTSINIHDAEAAVSSAKEHVTTIVTEPESNQMSKPATKDYNSCQKLTEPPAVGCKIAYKILEMSTTTYTPEISEFKEASLKSYDQETNTVELEVTEQPVKAKEGDTQAKGRFEMSESDADDKPEEVQKAVSVQWGELLEPLLIE